MNKKTTIWLIIAACLVVLGISLFTVALSISGWDFANMSSSQFETNTYKIPEDFTQIQIVTDTADIRLLPSEDGRCQVVCCELETARHAVAVEDGTLQIRLMDTRKWYEYIGIHWRQPTVTVYLPREAYEALRITTSTGHVQVNPGFSFQSMEISTSTGDIHLEDLSAGKIALKVSTGQVSARNIHCEDFSSTGSTGNLDLQNFVATGSIRIVRSTGHVKFKSCDGAELFIHTDTGDVTGTLLSDKIFFVETDTGKVTVPKSTIGGRCEITTDTGDVNIRISA